MFWGRAQMAHSTPVITHFTLHGEEMLLCVGDVSHMYQMPLDEQFLSNFPIVGACD